MRSSGFLRRSLQYVLLIFFCLVTLIPLAWITLTSLKTMKDIVTQGFLASPTTFHWENYLNAWKGGHFALYYRNSVIVAVAAVVGTVGFTLLAAYALAYMRFWGKRFWLTLVLLGLLIPGELTIIPLFHLLKDMRLLNTLGALIIPEIAGGLCFGIFLIRGFMKDIPPSLLESARMDGSTELTNLVSIVAPLIKPAAISLLIFTVIGSWNNFMLPTIMIQTDAWRTVPIGLNFFRSRFTIDFPLTSAAANIVALPVIIVYLVFQRNIIKGMMMGALKE